MAAIERLAAAPLSAVARECGVSVSVLHRWRKQIGNHRAIAPAGGRRRYPREFKEAAVLRLEQGEALPKVGRACQIDPTVLRRWWQEKKRYGEAAFPGYGKARSPVPSSRIAIVRFTQHEYEGIQAASAKEARSKRGSSFSSLPDFVRAQILTPAPSVAEIADRLEVLVSSVRRAAHEFL